MQWDIQRIEKRRRILFRSSALLLFCGLFCGSICAAAEDPVLWSLSLDQTSVPPGGQVLGRLTAKIQPGWHLYSLSTPPPPNATTIALADNPAIAAVKIFQPKPVSKIDPNFQVNTETYQSEAVFLLAIDLKKNAAPGAVTMAAQVRYQSCSDTKCLRPTQKTATAPLTIDPAAKSAAIVIPSGYNEFKGQVATAPAAAPAPVPFSAKGEEGLGEFLLIAFGAGLAAIFTPCVFPMIPFTVSYFLNRDTKVRRDSIVQAVVFCLGIVVLLTGLGLLAKAIAGPIGVVQLGSSPWVNAFITLVFIVFGLSLLGAYELALPSGLLTRLDQASQRGGYVGTLLMGLTFSLTSFACVGPIVGPLLVASVQSNGLQPVLGMLSFATGLAAPFFVLALFPAFLQKMPKSGGWLMRVKVVLGFVVLAISLKYLSNIDQVLQTGLISRQVFLAAWVILFALPGLYLLGFLHLEGIRPEDRLGIGRLLTGAAFLIFALSLVPGMFGARLGQLDAYVPAADNGGLAGNATNHSPEWMKNGYREALAKARQENKLVLVDFTGYACTNCHWMKANMFPRPEISSLLSNFVLVDLYTDGTDAVSEENGKLEETRFHTVTIPYYAIVDPSERVVATFDGSTTSAEQFARFLRSAQSGNGTVSS